MSCVVYYANTCQYSKKLLSDIKTLNLQHVHFVCIDRRVTGKDGKLYAVLKNEEHIRLPDNLANVPALLLLNEQKIIYGWQEVKAQIEKMNVGHIKIATNNNMEPLSKQQTNMIGDLNAFDGFNGSVVSDHYSFVNQSTEELMSQGNGGTRQMYNYVPYGDLGNTGVNYVADQPSNHRIKEGQYTIDSLKQQRERDLRR